MWTSPSEQRAPFGTCEQAMDNANALPTVCSRSLVSCPHIHKQTAIIFFILFFKNLFRS